MIVLGAVIVILSAFTASVIPGIGGIAMLLAEYVTLGQRRPTGAFLVTIIAGLLSAGCLLSVLTSDGDFPPRDVLSGLGSALFAAIALVHGVWAWRATPKRRRRYKT